MITVTIIAFIVGECAGLMTAAVISGGWDTYKEWRQRKHEKEAQDQMNEVHRRVAQEIDALIAPVGENDDDRHGTAEHKSGERPPSAACSQVPAAISCLLRCGQHMRLTAAGIACASSLFFNRP